MRFGLRGLLALVALCGIAYAAYDERRLGISRTCAMHRRGIETAVAVSETQNSVWWRSEPYSIELDPSGVSRVMSFDRTKTEYVGNPGLIANTVRDSSLFRCPAAPAAHERPMYRVVIKRSDGRCTIAHVECLAEPAHNDATNARYFLDRLWMTEAERLARCDGHL